MYDIIVIGSGPGGYVAAIRAAQLGKKVALVERAELGGVCLNWGCIPTKALLKSALVYQYATTAAQYGIEIDNAKADLGKIIDRSRNVADQMSKGVEFLLKKNNVVLITGHATIDSPNTVVVENVKYETENIIIATGARPREMDCIPVNGQNIVNSKQALALKKMPNTVVVIGSGAIGSEFATFYNTIGAKVTIVEYANKIAPLEDDEISATLERSMRKSKISLLTSTEVENVVTESTSDIVKVYCNGKKGKQIIEADIVLSAVGIVANIENLGLENLALNTDKGKITVNQNYQTSIESIYAIGDVIHTPALAHVASAEAINAVEYIAGLNPKPINYNHIPSCIYTSPEVSSVGMTEKQALELGFELRIGKFPFTASGKATAVGARDGMTKIIFDKKTDVILGAHFVGLNVTELVGETTLALNLGATAKDIISTIHAHPTMHEAIMEAAAAAHSEAIHL